VKAKGMVTRLVNEIDHLKILAGITPKVASAGKTEPKALGNKNCPVSGMQVGSMEPGAGIVYNNTLVGLCCNGCRTKFLSDPETYLKKATTEGH